MSGARGALGLIDLTWAGLADALDASLTKLNQDTGSPAVILRRAAWGSAPDRDFSLPRLSALATGLDKAITTDMSALHPATVLSAAAGRVLLNVLLLAADSLPEGGSVTLAGAADDLFVRISGPSAAWPPGTALCLADRFEAEAALRHGRHRQMAVTAALAHASGIRLSALMAPGRHPDPAILRLGG